MNDRELFCSNFDSCRRGVNPQLTLPLNENECSVKKCNGLYGCPNPYSCNKYQSAFIDCGTSCSENMVGRYTINKPEFSGFGGSYGTAPIADKYINYGTKGGCGGCYPSNDLTTSGCYRSYL